MNRRRLGLTFGKHGFEVVDSNSIFSSEGAISSNADFIGITAPALSILLAARNHTRPAISSPSLQGFMQQELEKRLRDPATPAYTVAFIVDANPPQAKSQSRLFVRLARLCRTKTPAIQCVKTYAWRKGRRITSRCGLPRNPTPKGDGPDRYRSSRGVIRTTWKLLEKRQFGSLRKNSAPCGKPRKPCLGLVADDQQNRRESGRGARAWRTS